MALRNSSSSGRLKNCSRQGGVPSVSAPSGSSAPLRTPEQPRQQRAAVGHAALSARQAATMAAVMPGGIHMPARWSTLLRAVASATATDVITVNVVVPKLETVMGQRVVLCGSADSLGNWDVKRAVPLQWGEGHTHSAKVELPLNQLVEAKVVLVQDGQPERWEGGANRRFELKPPADDAHAIMHDYSVLVPWNQPDKTQVVVKPNAAPPRQAPQPSLAQVATEAPPAFRQPSQQQQQQQQRPSSAVASVIAARAQEHQAGLRLQYGNGNGNGNGAAAANGNGKAGNASANGNGNNGNGSGDAALVARSPADQGRLERQMGELRAELEVMRAANTASEQALQRMSQQLTAAKLAQQQLVAQREQLRQMQESLRSARQMQLDKEAEAAAAEASALAARTQLQAEQQVREDLEMKLRAEQQARSAAEDAARIAQAAKDAAEAEAASARAASEAAMAAAEAKAAEAAKAVASSAAQMVAAGQQEPSHGQGGILGGLFGGNRQDSSTALTASALQARVSELLSKLQSTEERHAKEQMELRRRVEEAVGREREAREAAAALRDVIQRDVMGLRNELQEIVKKYVSVQQLAQEQAAQLEGAEKMRLQQVKSMGEEMETLRRKNDQMLAAMQQQAAELRRLQGSNVNVAVRA